MGKKSLVRQLYEDYSSILKEAKSMGCNEILALRNIPLESMEEIVNALKIVSELQDRGIGMETIERLISVGYELDEKNLTIQDTTEAIEKIIAKKPILKQYFKDLEEKYLCCHTCGEILIDRIPADNKEFYFYCINCGQKFDWE